MFFSDSKFLRILLRSNIWSCATSQFLWYCCSNWILVHWHFARSLFVSYCWKILQDTLVENCKYVLIIVSILCLKILSGIVTHRTSCNAYFIYRIPYIPYTIVIIMICITSRHFSCTFTYLCYAHQLDVLLLTGISFVMLIYLGII